MDGNLCTGCGGKNVYIRSYSFNSPNAFIISAKLSHWKLTNTDTAITVEMQWKLARWFFLPKQHVDVSVNRFRHRRLRVTGLTHGTGWTLRRESEVGRLRVSG